MSLFGHAFSVYLSALRIGIVTFFRGRWREGLKQFIAPVGYWRLWPNAVILSEFDKYRPARILDVSSPKLPSLILGRDAEIWATDLEDPQLLTRWKYTADPVRRPSKRACSSPKSQDEACSGLSALFPKSENN